MAALKFARKVVHSIQSKVYTQVEGLLLSDNPKLYFAIKSIEVSYEFLNKRRISLETKRVVAQLKANHNVKEGTLLKTLVPLNSRIEISTDEYANDWIKIPEGNILLFLGVDYDRNYDAATLKVLWKSKVYYIFRNAEFKDYNTNFSEKFLVLS